MFKRKWFVVILIMTYFQSIHSVSLVYGLAVRRLFKLKFTEEPQDAEKAISVLPIFFERLSHIVDEEDYLDVHEKRRVGGALLDFRYLSPQNWWIDLLTGIETDHSGFEGTECFKESQTGFDDIVLSGGYHHFFTHEAQLLGYALVGFPATRRVDLSDKFGPLVGTRFYNLGFGFEGSYIFVDNDRLMATAAVQQRFIHQFNRSWFPILPKGSIIQPGNITDILGALRFKSRGTTIEIAYNPTFFTNQATITCAEKVSTPNFVRHTEYITILHDFPRLFLDKKTVIGANFKVSTSKRNHALTLQPSLLFTVIF